MGAFLDHPKIEKFNDCGNGQKVKDSFQYALASMQGWRIDMEDAHHIIVSLKDHPPFQNWSFFAVFDGHAGSKVALHSAENLLHTFMDTKEFKQVAKEMKDKSMSEKIKKLIEEGLTKGFMKLDESMLKLHGDERERSGTTAVCALLTPEYIFFANLGDSRGVLSRKSCESFGTQDHKPYLDKERERIQKAGGSVMIQRVNGSLAVSRALGDFEYKSVPNLPQNEQLVSPEPDIYTIERNLQDDEFMVLACDGIFDVVENDELCELVRSRLKVTPSLTELTNQVLDICLSKGSRDNMTILLVVFDSAPKPDPAAVEAERQWALKMEAEINNIMNSGDMGADPDAEIVSNHLKKREKELELPEAGGIHVARSIIHRVLEQRSSTSSSTAPKMHADELPLRFNNEGDLEERAAGQIIYTAHGGSGGGGQNSTMHMMATSPTPTAKSPTQALPTKIKAPLTVGNAVAAADDDLAAEAAAIGKAQTLDSTATLSQQKLSKHKPAAMDGGDLEKNNVGVTPPQPTTESTAKMTPPPPANS